MGLSLFLLNRVVDHQVRLKTHLRDLLGKEVVYVLPITYILGRLPVVRAGDTGTIPFSYRDGCRNGAHRYNHDLASADTPVPGLGTAVPCTLSILGRWAGPAIRDIGMKR